MGHTVEFYFDPEAEARVLRLWDQFSRHGIDPFLPGLGACPHIGLTVR